MRLALVAALLIASPAAAFPTADDGGSECTRIQTQTMYSLHPVRLEPTSNGSTNASSNITMRAYSVNAVAINASLEFGAQIAVQASARCADGGVETGGFILLQPRPAIAPRALDITGIRVVFVESTEAVIQWNTGAPTVGRVVWGPLNGDPTAVADSDSDFYVSHQVRLTGLQPGGHYAFYVLAFDRQARIAQSEDSVFHVPTSPVDLAIQVAFVGLSAAGTVAVAWSLWRKHR